MRLVFNNNGNTEIYTDVLKAICGQTENKSMIDLGSGNAPVTCILGFKERSYIDIVNRDIGAENINFFQIDILEFIDNVLPMSLDVSISLDNIEHYYPDDAKKVISWMQNNSYKQIIFTPLGEYMTTKQEGNIDPDIHKSAWIPKDFEDMDFSVIIFPNYHPTLGENGLGAFFAFKCDNLEQEFERINNELKNKLWTM